MNLGVVLGTLGRAPVPSPTPPHAPVIPGREPLHALGYALDEDGVRPLARTLRRLPQRGRRYVFEEGMSRARMARSLAATNGLFLP